MCSDITAIACNGIGPHWGAVIPYSRQIAMLSGRPISPWDVLEIELMRAGTASTAGNKFVIDLMARSTTESGFGLHESCPQAGEVVRSKLTVAPAESIESRSTEPVVAVRLAATTVPRRAGASSIVRRRTDRVLLRLDRRGPAGSMTAHSANGGSVGVRCVSHTGSCVSELSAAALSSPPSVNSAEEETFHSSHRRRLLPKSACLGPRPQELGHGVLRS